MKKPFSFPKLEKRESGGANNSPFLIWIGMKHPNRAALIPHEKREHTIAWRWHYGPTFAGLAVAVAAFLLSSLILGGVALALLAIGLGYGKTKRFAAYRGMRGQVTEAVAATWLYGRELDAELYAAAAQLYGSKSYRTKYGLEGQSLEQILARLAKMVPEARKWIAAHRRMIERGYRWIEVQEPPSYTAWAR